MQPSFIECIGLTPGTDKNGKEYVRVHFRNRSYDEVIDPVSGEIFFARKHSPIGSINQYPIGYTSTGRPDLYYDIKIGEVVEGEVIQKDVEPYTTEKGFTITYFNAVVFGDSTKASWEKAIQRAFEREKKIPVMPVPERVEIKFNNTTDDHNQIQRDP